MLVKNKFHFFMLYKASIKVTHFFQIFSHLFNSVNSFKTILFTFFKVISKDMLNSICLNCLDILNRFSDISKRRLIFFDSVQKALQKFA